MSFFNSSISPAISVVVPVYNAEKYLPSCLDSLLGQTFGDFEAFLVDDCSTDNSRKICEDYSAKDHRLKVLCHSVNSGPGASRNTALAAACGETVFFLDADDLLPERALELLFRIYKLYDADVCSGIFSYFDDSGEIDTPFVFFAEEKSWAESEIKTVFQSYIRAPNREFLFAYAWGKLYKRSVMVEHSLHFNESMKTFEDLKFLCQFVAVSEKIYFSPHMVYNYRVHSNTKNLSMIVSKKHNRLLDLFWHYQEMLLFSENVGILKRDVDNCMINLAIIHIVRHCVALNIKNFILLYDQVRSLICQPGFAPAIKNYDSSVPGRSKWMPFFMRYKLVIPLLLLGKYKAWKRYKKGKQ